MQKETIQAYSRILHRELVAAMGCTEPIAIAYAAAKCRQVLGMEPEHCHVLCSGNIVKNVMGVTVPNSGGLKGIDVAATLGVLGGNADRDLEVLASVTEAHIAKAKQLLAQDFCSCALVQNVENLYIQIQLRAGEHSAVVEIRSYHKNITKIEKDGELLYQQEVSCNEVPVKEDPDKALLNIAEILEYGDLLDDPEVIRVGRHLLYIVALTAPFQVAQVISRGCLNGAGDTKFTAVVSFMSIALVRPVLTYVLCYPMGLGVYGAWISLFIDQVTRFVFTAFRFRGSAWYQKKI